MNKNFLLGVFVTIVVAGLSVMLSHESLRFGEAIGLLRGLSPRILALIVMPFLAALFVAGTYLRKKNEQRKWKNALLKTRAKKQNKPAKPAPGEPKNNTA